MQKDATCAFPLVGSSYCPTGILLRAWIHCAVKIGMRKINLALLWPWRYFLEIILNTFLLCLSVRNISSKSSGQGKIQVHWEVAVLSSFFSHFQLCLPPTFPPTLTGEIHQNCLIYPSPSTKHNIEPFLFIFKDFANIK